MEVDFCQSMSLWVRLCVYNYVIGSIVYMCVCVCVLACAYMLMRNVCLCVHANMCAFVRFFFKKNSHQ